MALRIRENILPVLNKFVYLLLPGTCIICRLPSQRPLDLCKHCEDNLPWLVKSCYRCALPLPHTTDGIICGRCLQQQPVFDRCVALFYYQAPIDGLLNQLKFHHCLRNAHILGTLLSEKIKQVYIEDTLPQVIIPVPLHRKRLRQRGYNQALELAKPIAKHLRLPIDKWNHQRTRFTPPQTRLKVMQRHKNMRHVFSSKTLQTKHVAIIDDVMTSGATVNALSRCLRQAGVEKIDVWVCARTTLQPT